MALIYRHRCNHNANLKEILYEKHWRKQKAKRTRIKNRTIKLQKNIWLQYIIQRTTLTQTLSTLFTYSTYVGHPYITYVQYLRRPSLHYLRTTSTQSLRTLLTQSTYVDHEYIDYVDNGITIRRTSKKSKSIQDAILIAKTSGLKLETNI